MTKKVSLEKVLLFNQVATNILQKYQGKESLFLNSIKKSIKGIKSHVADYEEVILDKKIDLAGKDKEGFILYAENGGYKFTPESTKELKKFTNSELEKEIDVNVFQSDDKIELEIDYFTKEALTPFIFKEEKLD